MDAKEEFVFQILRLVRDAVREAGPGGLPAGHLYAILRQHGCTLEQFDAITGALEHGRLIERKGDLLRALPVGAVYVNGARTELSGQMIDGGQAVSTDRYIPAPE